VRRTREARRSGDIGKVNVLINDTSRQVTCYFDPADEASLSDLEPGVLAVVEGECTGLLGNVNFDSCKLLRVEIVSELERRSPRLNNQNGLR
jgi:hypothetical protein